MARNTRTWNTGNAIESAALYRLLEEDIVPTFYSRPGGAAPPLWTAMMKSSIKMALGFFTSRRMVLEYREKFYRPASEDYQRLMAREGEAAKALRAKKVRLDANWHQVRVSTPRAERELSGLHTGDTFEVTTNVFPRGFETGGSSGGDLHGACGGRKSGKKPDMYPHEPEKTPGLTAPTSTPFPSPARKAGVLPSRYAPCQWATNGKLLHLAT